jgi:hypothetical protein
MVPPRTRRRDHLEVREHPAVLFRVSDLRGPAPGQEERRAAAEAHAAVEAAPGIATWNELPSPGVLSAQILPP